MNPRLFIKADIKCLSPLAIGSGQSENTDKDVLLSSDGKPYIPGSALAGVCRHFVEKDKYDVNSLFGNHEDESESRIVFYDALLNGTFVKKYRDSVRISDDGTAADTGKFDYEVIDFPKDTSSFLMRIEVLDYDSVNDKPIIDMIMSGIQSGEIRVGHKTNRGFGRITLSNPRMLGVNTVEDLIKFNWDKVNNPITVSNCISNDYYSMSAEYRVKSFVTIANNASLRTKDDGNFINSEPQKRANNKAVIPGTSWGGVFRHHFASILDCVGYNEKESFLENIFGSTEKASSIIFDETVIEDNHFMLQTRNAIDRFTGGACDAKLFTNEMSFGGHLKLTVSLRGNLDEKDKELAISLIETTFSDLGDGSLNIGGLGSVGGGILERIGK